MSGCAKDETTIDGFHAIEIKKDQHASSPWSLIIDRSEPSYMWRFSESAEYCHNDTCFWTGDQKDWNKLIGLSWNLFDNHVNSAMVGWRWNTHYGVMELNAYFHINEVRVITDVLATVQINQNFQTWINLLPDDRVRVHVETEANLIEGFFSQQGTYIAEFQRQNLRPTTRKIFTWFGGNLAAPHDIIIYRKKNE